VEIGGIYGWGRKTSKFYWEMLCAQSRFHKGGTMEYPGIECDDIYLLCSISKMVLSLPCALMMMIMGKCGELIYIYIYVCVCVCV